MTSYIPWLRHHLPMATGDTRLLHAFPAVIGWHPSYLLFSSLPLSHIALLPFPLNTSILFPLNTSEAVTMARRELRSLRLSSPSVQLPLLVVSGALATTSSLPHVVFLGTIPCCNSFALPLP